MPSRRVSFSSSRRLSIGAPVPSQPSRRSCAFDIEPFLNSAGFHRTVSDFQRKDIIFSQGDLSNDVLFIREGSVKVAAVNPAGKEAVIGMLGPGDFLGEGCLTGQLVRATTATALTPTSVLVIDKHEMTRVLHTQSEFSDRFLAFLLTREIRIEEDMVDQILNRSEKRLARALLLLAGYGEQGQPQTEIPAISHDVLGEMIGTTRTRVTHFMSKFKKQGFISYGAKLRGLQINKSLLSTVLQNDASKPPQALAR
jgi:CRP/FNR family cyclic AMP-dependent transcriptional regulator